MKSEIKKHIEVNENGNETNQNLWKAAKAVLGGQFTVINADLRKQEMSQMNTINFIPQELEKRRTKSKVGRWKEITKMRAEINETSKQCVSVYFFIVIS